MLCVTWLLVEESDGGQREEKENTVIVLVSVCSHIIVF